MPDAAAAHPSFDLLRAYCLGQLGPLDAAALERHVADCPACGQALRSVADDRLVQLLPGNAAEEPRGDTNDQGATGPEAPAPVPCPMAPELTDHPRYRVLKVLGAGGMGVVYKAEHRLMERVVALKIIKRGLVERPEAVERFAREVKAAAQLTHPNIVRAYDAEQAGDRHFLVMEFIEGTNLARLVEERGPLPVVQACNCVRQAAMGLQHAHARGMVHRDIKPHNLMLTPDGWIKVLDFGLARFARESGAAAGLTPNQALLGTPDYIAPEQATDAHRADIRSDIYSLGCTLYFLLTGQPPHPGGDFVHKVMGHLHGTPRAVAELRPDLPPELVRLIERMMARDPVERYQTPAEVVQALVPLLRPAAGTAPSDTPPMTATPGLVLSHRRPLVVAFAGLFVLAVVLAAGVAILAGRWRGPAHERAASQGAEGQQTGGKRAAGLPDQPGDHPGGVGEVRRYLGHRMEVRCVAFSADGRRFLSGSFGQLFLWEVESKTETRRFDGEAGWVHCVAFAPDGRVAVSGGQDRVLHVWDMETGKELDRLGKLDVGASPIECVAFAPNGRHFLYTQDSVGRLCEAETRKEVQRFPGRVACFSADGRKVLSAADSVLCLSEAATGRELQKIESRNHAISCVALSPDGQLALSGSEDNRDKNVGLWDVKTGKEVLFEGHTECVTGVAFCADGLRALSSSNDKTLRLWDVKTGKELYRFEGHAAGVACLALSPDGQLALSGGWDASVRLWRLPK